MTYELTVDGKALHDAVARLKKITRRVSGEAVLSFDGLYVALEVPGATVAVPATGSWPGRVIVGAQWLVGLAEATRTATVSLTVDGGWLAIGGFRTSCQVDERRGLDIPLPLNASLGEIVAVALLHTDDEITRSGLGTTVKRGKDRYERALARATEDLKGLDLTTEELRAFVEQRLRERYGDQYG